MTQAVPVRERRTLLISGAVQGVGFRPFVYRLARELGLEGYVRNESGRVYVDAEGLPIELDELQRRIVADAPPPARPRRLEAVRGALRGYDSFSIADSADHAAGVSALVPDQATCEACRTEILAANGRRAGYAFTSCTECGPRYTIASALAFDRSATSMEGFTLCETCRGEYDSPADRRFHAQTNACPRCGPRLRWSGASESSSCADPIEAAAAAIRSGGVVALQGVGGFQLLADARNEAAAARLREIKRREAKPFAVMYPSLAAVHEDCYVSAAEAALLEDSAAPITLLRPRPGCALAPSVGRSAPSVGAFLPYSPVHWLLLDKLDRPLIATSANLSDEPILTAASEALGAFGPVVDGTLHHDRAILRPCDDSVARIISGRPTLLRRSRGYTPSPILLRRPCRPVLALGGHLKTTVAIAAGHEATLSPHIGDLDTVSVRRAYEGEVERMLTLHRFTPEVVACDLHPEYFSTRFAPSFGKPVVQLQHHEAHAAACAAEHGLDAPYLGVAWDGTGYGRDGAIWGSEFFLVEDGRFERVAHLRPFRLPGGDAAARDGRRCAVSLLGEVFGDDFHGELGLSDVERRTFMQQATRGLNAPWTTSAGRLFDAVAALAGVALRSAFEGEAAMLLEGSAARSAASDECAYPADIDERERLELDWRPLMEVLQRDVAECAAPDLIAARFHAAMAEWIVEIARRIGVPDVVLSGGVFQNAYLTENVSRRLDDSGFRVRTHRQVPPNDGGLALGQAVLAGRED